MTATYSPFQGDFSQYGGSTEHPWFSWDQPLTVNPGTVNPTTSGGFLGSGFPQSGGFLSSQFNPMQFAPMDFGGVGAPGVGGPGGVSGGAGTSGPSSGVAATSAGQTGVDAVQAIASVMGMPGIGIAQAIANMLAPHSTMNQPGVATVDVSSNNVMADIANIAAQQAIASQDPSVSVVGENVVGPVGVSTSSAAQDASANQQAPGNATGVDDSPGDPSGDASGNWRRGGYIRRYAPGGSVLRDPGRDDRKMARWLRDVHREQYPERAGALPDFAPQPTAPSRPVPDLEDREELLQALGPYLMELLGRGEQQPLPLNPETMDIRQERRGGAIRKAAMGGKSQDWLIVKNEDGRPIARSMDARLRDWFPLSHPMWSEENIDHKPPERLPRNLDKLNKARGGFMRASNG